MWYDYFVTWRAFAQTTDNYHDYCTVACQLSVRRIPEALEECLCFDLLLLLCCFDFKINFGAWLGLLTDCSREAPSRPTIFVMHKTDVFCQLA